MFEIIYKSTATEAINHEDLQKISAKSNSNNSYRRVSGCLIYTGKHFVQILEGQRKTLEDLIFKIRQDKRHTDFTILSAREINQRLFGTWSMAVLDFNENAFEGYEKFKKNLKHLSHSSKLDMGSQDFCQAIIELLNHK